METSGADADHTPDAVSSREPTQPGPVRRRLGLPLLTVVALVTVVWDATTVTLLANSDGWTSTWGRMIAAVIFLTPLTLMVVIAANQRRRGAPWAVTIRSASAVGLISGLLVLPLTVWW